MMINHHENGALCTPKILSFHFTIMRPCDIIGAAACFRAEPKPLFRQSTKVFPYHFSDADYRHVKLLHVKIPQEAVKSGFRG